MQIRSILSLLLLTLLFAAACAQTRRTASTPDAATATISADALHQRLQSRTPPPLVVDVREPHEYQAGHIDGARLAPLGNVLSELANVEKDREIVLVCRSGNRSGKAQKLLAAEGYTRLRNMEGGMLAWEKNGHPIVK